MYKDKEELNEISKKITPNLKDILIYLDCKLRYIE